MPYNYDPNLGPVSSALTLRMVLAILGLVFSIAGVVLMLVISQPFWAIFFGAVGITAVVDMVVIRRRMRQRHDEEQRR